jgi:MraZ protein
MGRSGFEWRKVANPLTERLKLADLLGSYLHTLDEKGRVSIPAKLRRELLPKSNNTLIITRGLEGCLFLYPRDEWDRVKEKLRTLSFTQPDARMFIRIIASNANEITLDSQGRLVVPPNLREVSGLQREVLIVGSLDRVELWNPELYEQYFEKSGKSYEEVAETIFF